MIFDCCVQADVGYINSDFHWDIGSDKGTNVVSELEWNGLCGPYALLNLRAEIYTTWFAILEGESALFTSGSATDSDYDESGRKALSYRSISSANGSELWGWRAVLGHSFFFCMDAWKVDVSLGYRASRQRFKMKGGDITGGTDFELGPISDVRNRYVTLWRGLEANVNTAYRYDAWSFEALISLFFPTYDAKGYWNLRTDIIGPFIHHASNGFGSTLGGSITYYFPCFSIGLSAKFGHLSTSHGIDKTKWKDPFGQIRLCQGRLNNVIFNTRIYTLNLEFPF